MDFTDEDKENLINGIIEKIGEKVENFLDTINLNYLMELFLEHVDIEEILKKIGEKS